MICSPAPVRRRPGSTSTSARPRSTAAATRCSATSSPSSCSACEEDRVNFDYSDEQRALHESLARWLDKHYTFAQRRERLHAAQTIDENTWHTLAEMGLLALPLPEDHGGLGGGSVDVAGVMGLLGAKLVLEPYLPTVLSAMLLADTGTPVQRERWLPEVAQGRLRLAFAHGEPGSRHARTRVTTTARRDGDPWRLDGHKAVVV